MPNFLLGPLLINFFFFITLVYWVISKPPSSIIAILIFLAILFLTLALALSFPVYFVIIRRKHFHGLEKKVFRKSLKIAAFVSFVLVGILALKGFQLWNILNAGLFLVLCGVSATVVFKSDSKLG